MNSYFYDTKPAFIHDCNQCEFIKSIRRDDGFTIDIYKSCEASMSKYLIRTGSNPEDYSTPGIESLAIHYAEKMKGE